MKKFLNILQKEIKDLLTLKMVLPFIISIFILLFVGELMQIEIGRAMKPTNIVIIDNDKTQSSLIPFSHPFFAFKFLIMGQRLPVILGIIYLCLFAIGLLIIATKIFSSEHILTMKFNFGRIKKLL